MQDRYLYKAKRADNGEWVEGFYFLMAYEGGEIPCIGTDPLTANDYSEIHRYCYEEIDPTTLCKCTGENGLCEHDIFNLGDENILYEVVWHDTGFMGKQIKSSSYVGLSYWSDRIVKMGNRFDNPELLEV